jgi:hypothetical protein
MVSLTVAIATTRLTMMQPIDQPLVDEDHTSPVVIPTPGRKGKPHAHFLKV